MNTSLTIDPSRVNTYSIGFDRMFDSMLNYPSKNHTYPPYNIVKHSDDKYTIEMAVAGFSKDDIHATRHLFEHLFKRSEGELFKDQLASARGKFTSSEPTTMILEFIETANTRGFCRTGAL